MKKFVLLFLMMLLAVPIIAQVIDPPENIVDVVGNIDGYMGSLLGLALLSTFLTGIVNGWLKVVKDWIRQVISWVIPIIIAVVLGFLLNFGFLAEEPWYIAVLYGLGAGLVSNGLFDINFVHVAVKWVEGLLNSKINKPD